MIVLLPETIVPLSENPIVESTVITFEPAADSSTDLLFGVILNTPLMSEISSYPINRSIWYKTSLSVTTACISDTDASLEELSLNTDWPFNFKGFPDTNLAKATCLLLNFAEEGLSISSSKFITFGSLP